MSAKASFVYVQTLHMLLCKSNWIQLHSARPIGIQPQQHVVGEHVHVAKLGRTESHPWLAAWLLDSWLAGRLAGWLPGWMLVGWLAGCLAGWLPGWPAS